MKKFLMLYFGVPLIMVAWIYPRLVEQLGTETIANQVGGSLLIGIAFIAVIGMWALNQKRGSEKK